MRHILLGTCLALIACEGPLPTEDTSQTTANGPQPQASGSSEPDEVYTLTIITQNADGTFSTVKQPVTRSAQLAAARAATKEAAAAAMNAPLGRTSVSGGVESSQQALAGWTRTNCPANYLWLFAGSNLTGDELCFHGPAAWDLSQFGVPAAPPSITWVGKTHSYWAGDESGFFAQHYCDNQNSTGTSYHFNTWERNNSYSGVSNWVFQSVLCL
jgi:hypothetical protein